MQSMWVCSLNHDLTTSYRLGHTPFFLKNHPHLLFTWITIPVPPEYFQNPLGNPVCIRHKGVHICPSTASQCAQTLCIHPIWMWDESMGVYSLNHDLTTSYLQARPYPIFPKNSPPPACVIRHKGVHICPSTASQGAQTLFISLSVNSQFCDYWHI